MKDSADRKKLNIASLYEDIMDRINEAVFIHDAETGEVLDVNQSMLKMFGCSHKGQALGFLGDRFSLGEPPYSMAEVSAWVRKTASEGPQIFKWRSRRLDGTLFWAEVSLSPIEAKGQKLIVAVLRDITSRISQEAELRDSISRYQALFENENRDVIIFRPMETGEFQDFVVVDMNSSAEKTEKVRRKDIVGKSMLEIFPGARETGLFKVFQDVSRTGHSETFHFKKLAKGHIMSWREMAIARLPRGEIAAVCQDRTREKQTEEALLQQESLLQAILDTLPAAVCLVDSKTRVFKWISPYVEEITGYTPAELIGGTPRKLYPTDEEYQRVGRAYQLFAFQKLVEIETEFRHKDGHPISILLKAIMKDTNLLCVIFDITDRKRAEMDRLEMERHLLHVQKLESLGVLAGGIAHDFNNLLMGIMGNAELLSMMLPKNSKPVKYVHSILKASERAASLCGQMLAYSGRANFKKEVVDVSKLVRKMKGMLMVSISKRVRLNFRLPEKLPLIEADPTQMSQVIMNLIINSSEAIGDKQGTITLSTGVTYCSEDYLAQISLDEQLPEGEYVSIEISDNGCGMDETIKKRIFEPFFTTKFTGRGLGMAAVHGIVRAHQGGIEIHSTQDEGTKVRILLPTIGTACGKDAHLGSALPYETKRPLVLLVDDEPEIRSLGKEMLEMSGYSVMVAENGISALELFRQHSHEIKCVILDLTMPEMDGEETLQQLISICPKAKIVISSGHDMANMASRLKGVKVSGFLKKPYRLTQIKELLGRVI